jgi:hypothetical protein
VWLRTYQAIDHVPERKGMTAFISLVLGGLLFMLLLVVIAKQKY